MKPKKESEQAQTFAGCLLHPPQTALTGYRSLLLACVLLLASCTQLQTGIDSNIDTSGNTQALQDISEWSVRGRLNIRTQDEARTPDLRWEQEQDNFSIRLSGLLNAVTMRSIEEGVVLEQSGEEPVYANSISELSIYFLGYDYPAERLLYWIRGLPAPDIPHKLTLNDQQLPLSLDQDGWTLTYDRYQEVDNVILPGKIVITSQDDDNVRLTFLNLSWTLPR